MATRQNGPRNETNRQYGRNLVAELFFDCRDHLVDTYLDLVNGIARQIEHGHHLVDGTLLDGQPVCHVRIVNRHVRPFESRLAS